MNPDSQIKALAILDGWTYVRLQVLGAGAPERRPVPCGVPPGKSYRATCNDYLRSRDMIVPLRQRICCLNQDVKVKWLNTARDILQRKLQRKISDYDLACIEPCDDAEAILRITGKWLEE